MYPLNAAKPWKENQWYVAFPAHEITAKPTARMLLDQPLVFFRTSVGKAVALWGLCPHRLMPLEYGAVEADTLVCRYHGFRFDAKGLCVEVPTDDQVSSRCQLRSYPVIERGPFLWVWMGDAAKADVDLLPDTTDVGIGDDIKGWRVDVTASYLLKARTQLLMDNLFDLSHLAFTHKNSAPPDVVKMALLPPRIEEDKERFRVFRELPTSGVEPDSFLAMLLPHETGEVRQILVTDLYSSGLLNAGGPWMWRANPDGSMGEELGRLNVMHAFTPETAHSTHYFGAVTRNVRIDDEQLSQFVVTSNDIVRREDIVVLEAIEKVADKYGDTRKEISVRTDAGAILARRKVKALIEQEGA